MRAAPADDRLGLLELLQACAFSDEVGVPRPAVADSHAELRELLGVDDACASSG